MASRRRAQRAPEASQEDLDALVGETKEEVRQREITLEPGPVKEPPSAPGKRVKVYNKYPADIWLSDGRKMKALSECYILESDAQIPGIAKHILRLAE